MLAPQRCPSHPLTPLEVPDGHKPETVSAMPPAGISAEVDVGMKGLPMVDMLSFTLALRMTLFATSEVATVDRVTVAGVGLRMRVQTTEL